MGSKNFIAAEMADQATGCREHPGGYGKIFDDRDKSGKTVLSLKKAKKLFWEDEVVLAVPNAGAGTFHSLLEDLGAVKVQSLDTSSSAGDWCLQARMPDGRIFHISQSNRYPHHGFSYYCEPWNFDHDINYGTINGLFDNEQSLS